MLSEFKPSLLFLGKFLAIYLVGNVVYGLWINSFDNLADTMTTTVTENTSHILNACGENTNIAVNLSAPTVRLENEGGTVLNVFEGCNGINVMIVFVAFVVAFGGALNKMAWFVPLGLVVIHIFNLIRISLLYYVAQHYQSYFYYVHKYVFTAALYVIVLALWVIWVMKLNVRPAKTGND